MNQSDANRLLSQMMSKMQNTFSQYGSQVVKALTDPKGSSLSALNNQVQQSLTSAMQSLGGVAKQQQGNPYQALQNLAGSPPAAPSAAAATTALRNALGTPAPTMQGATAALQNKLGGGGGEAPTMATLQNELNKYGK